MDQILTRHTVTYGDKKIHFELERKSNQNKQELNEERLSFYTNITHELRTPLTLIIGPLEDMVQDSGLPKVYTKKIGIIHSSAVRLLNLINQLLEFRKTETNNRKLYVAKENIANDVRRLTTMHIDARSKYTVCIR